jgi:hypothetical protein
MSSQYEKSMGRIEETFPSVVPKPLTSIREHFAQWWDQQYDLEPKIILGAAPLVAGLGVYAVAMGTFAIAERVVRNASDLLQGRL